MQFVVYSIQIVYAVKVEVEKGGKLIVDVVSKPPKVQAIPTVIHPKTGPLTEVQLNTLNGKVMEKLFGELYAQAAGVNMPMPIKEEMS